MSEGNPEPAARETPPSSAGRVIGMFLGACVLMVAGIAIVGGPTVLVSLTMAGAGTGMGLPILPIAFVLLCVVASPFVLIAMVVIALRGDRPPPARAKAPEPPRRKPPISPWRRYASRH